MTVLQNFMYSPGDKNEGGTTSANAGKDLEDSAAETDENKEEKTHRRKNQGGITGVVQ